MSQVQQRLDGGVGDLVKITAKLRGRRDVVIYLRDVRENRAYAISHQCCQHRRLSVFDSWSDGRQVNNPSKLRSTRRNRQEINRPLWFVPQCNRKHRARIPATQPSVGGDCFDGKSIAPSVNRDAGEYGEQLAQAALGEPVVVVRVTVKPNQKRGRCNANASGLKDAMHFSDCSPGVANMLKDLIKHNQVVRAIPVIGHALDIHGRIVWSDFVGTVGEHRLDDIVRTSQFYCANSTTVAEAPAKEALNSSIVGVLKKMLVLQRAWVKG